MCLTTDRIYLSNTKCCFKSWSSLTGDEITSRQGHYQSIKDRAVYPFPNLWRLNKKLVLLFRHSIVEI
uniref:Uncharacterized protein n=1 Tax=Pararge aegeria TaxID=116150 RepID=S4PF85_9NEOP